jgi:hypothetical protein
MQNTLAAVASREVGDFDNLIASFPATLRWGFGIAAKLKILCGHMI